MSKLFIVDGKAIVSDESHWITINGKHVPINEKGEVQAGLGGKFNGRRISKFQGAPSRESLSSAYGENGVKADKAWAKRNEIENSKEYKKAKAGLNRIDKLLDKSGDSLQYWQPEKYASLVALREQYASQMKAMKEGVGREIKKISGAEKNLRNALNRGKNGVYTNQTEKRNRLAQSIENSERVRANREKKVKEKTDAIESKYNKMAERLQNRADELGRKNERHYGYEQLASEVARRGQQLAENVRENTRAGLTWSNRKNEAWHKNNYELDKTEKKVNALKKFKDGQRTKLANAQQANAYIAQAKGTRVSKATPSMLGGKFTNAQKEQKESYNRYRTEMNRADKEVKKASAERDKVYEELNKKEERLGKDLNKSIKYGQAAVRVGMLNPKYKKLSVRLMERENQKYKDYEEGRKESDVRANEADRKYREVYERNAERETKAGERHIANGYKIGRKLNEVKKALAKARPKIAERRQAIRKYNKSN